MKHLILALLLVFATGALYAADVTGKWKGSFEAPDGTRELTFDLKADGAKLTGTVSAGHSGVEVIHASPA